MEKYEKDGALSYCIGTTLTFELLLRKPETATRIFISPKQKRDETYQKLVDLATKYSLPLITNNEKIFRNLSGKDNVMVIGEFRKFTSTLPKDLSHVVLVNPSNMGNLGTIIRSASAFAMGGLAIITPAADLYDPRVIRASMGAIFSLPIVTYASFNDYQKAYPNHHYYPFMLKATIPLNTLALEEPASLIFGNEATGLDDSYLKVGTPTIIKQSSQVDSLNLDNAVSIGLYAYSLRRKY